MDNPNDDWTGLLIFVNIIIVIDLILIARYFGGQVTK
jgi:hypothetical protein